MAVAMAEEQDIEKIISEKIEAILQQKLSELTPSQKAPLLSSGSSIDDKFLVISERIVRVEEELKNQRDLLVQMQKNSDMRFELMEKRFAAIDKRFEDMYKYMDKRFDAVDKRFEDMYKYMNKRFDAVDKRSEDIQRNMDKRFEAVNKKFTLMQWVMAIGFVSLGTLVSVIKIFG